MPVDLHDTGEDVHGPAIAELADLTITEWLEKSWASEPTEATASWLSAGANAALVRFAFSRLGEGIDPRVYGAGLLDTIVRSTADLIAQHVAGLEMGGAPRGRMQ